MYFQSLRTCNDMTLVRKSKGWSKTS